MDMKSNKCYQSQMVEISPERQKAFIEFVHSLPRTCSPSMFEQRCSPSLTKFDGSPSLVRQLPKSLLDYSSDDDPDQFNWSIEEYALVYGKDFSNEHEQEQFHSLIHTPAISKELEQENERYFSQEMILPSPSFRNRSSRNQSLLFGMNNADEDYVSRNTGSFIRWIDSLPLHSTQYEDCYDHHYRHQQQQQQSESAIVNDVSMKSNDIIEAQKLIKNGCQQAQTSIKTDSDFVSMNGQYGDEEQMELNICSSFSNRNHHKKLSFIDFSKSSTSASSSSLWTPKVNNRRCDFDVGSSGQQIPIDKFIEDISPIIAYPSSSMQSSLSICQQQKKNRVIQQFHESNKENSPKYFSSPIVDQLNFGTVKKHAFNIRSNIYSSFQSKSNIIVHHSPKHRQKQQSGMLLFRPRLQEESPKFINHGRNNRANETVEFKTPQSSTRRSRISRAKLFFNNEYASTPN